MLRGCGATSRFGEVGANLTRSRGPLCHRIPSHRVPTDRPSVSACNFMRDPSSTFQRGSPVTPRFAMVPLQSPVIA